MGDHLGTAGVVGGLPFPSFFPHPRLSLKKKFFFQVDLVKACFLSPLFVCPLFNISTGVERTAGPIGINLV